MMTNAHPLLDTLHEATHRMPGVPEHVDHPSGHQGVPRHGRTRRAASDRHAPRTRNHSPARPPRVLVAWQRWIASLFGQELR